MGRTFAQIDDALAAWLAEQRLFFVATAPLAPDGHVNVSPKGLDTFRVVGPAQVAYLDLTGSGAETVAHLRENGRITLMFCAFEGPARIVRLHGRGEAAEPGTHTWERLVPEFPALPGSRSIVSVAVHRISESCGYAVPHYRYQGQRDRLIRWARRLGPSGLESYRQRKNAASLDGLPALPSAEGRA
jgi:hypothetical protein